MDRRAPVGDVPVVLPYGVFLAGFSPVWSGARAFLDVSPGRALGRAWLLRQRQFEDVVAQENGRAWAPVDVAGMTAGDQRVVGSGWYSLLVCVDVWDDVPVVSFTCPAPPGGAGVPSLSYLQVLGSGLMESHGLTARDAAAYLAGLPGARGAVDAGVLAAVLAGGQAVAS